MPTDAELAVEGLRKSSVLWLDLPGQGHARAAWHGFVDGAAYVVHEGLEQQLPGLRTATTALVSLRAKDSRALLVRFVATVETISPDDPRWAPAVSDLHARRQSPPDGESQPARWATGSVLTRLTPG